MGREDRTLGGPQRVIVSSVGEHPHDDPATQRFQDREQYGTHLKGQSQLSGRHLEHVVSTGTQKVL
jgi:hypothetical protein